MFTIEHDFDATVITLVDEGDAPLREDTVISAFSEVIRITQFNPHSEQMQVIEMSMAQLQDLAAALDLPEGVYRLQMGKDAE